MAALHFRQYILLTINRSVTFFTTIMEVEDNAQGNVRGREEEDVHNHRNVQRNLGQNNRNDSFS